MGNATVATGRSFFSLQGVDIALAKAMAAPVSASVRLSSRNFFGSSCDERNVWGIFK